MSQQSLIKSDFVHHIAIALHNDRERNKQENGSHLEQSDRLVCRHS